MITAPRETLADVGPYGTLPPRAWATLDVDFRRRAVLAESRMRVAGAAEVILSMCLYMEESRAAALLFIASSLTETARLLERAHAADRPVDEGAPAAGGNGARSRVPRPRRIKPRQTDGRAPA